MKRAQGFCEKDGPLVLELRGLAVPGAAVHLGRVGQVLARHPHLCPTRVGTTDPPRAHLVEPVDQLTTLGVEQAAKVNAMVHLARPESGGTGTVSYVADPFRGHPPSFVHPSQIDLTFHAGDALDIAELLAELAEQTDAFYGFVSARSYLAQLRGVFGTEQRRRHGGPPSGGQPPSWQPPPFQALELSLPDVFWVQVFGPAFVDMWGVHRVEAAGSRRRRLSNGGYVVWACDDPPTHDPDTLHPESYGWKASVYDALGPEPFVRHDRAWNDFGEHVPLMSAHATALTTAAPGL